MLISYFGVKKLKLQKATSKSIFFSLNRPIWVSKNPELYADIGSEEIIQRKYNVKKVQ
jgi:hypothetical protein